MFSTLTALYVEDEEEIKSVVIRVFGPLFKNFYVAGDGLEGLELFKEHVGDIDIIITDINMPELNGLDMCDSIREIDNKVPIVITTAHNDKDFLHKAIQIGVTGFVVKPMDMEKLVKTVKKSVEPIILQQKLDEEMRLHEEERIMSAKFSAIGQLAAGITHEINTPLTYIKASFEMIGYNIEEIEDESLRNDIMRDMDRVYDGIVRIENIVGSMKEMSQQSTMTKEKSNIYSTVITSTILAYNRIKHMANVYINGKLFNLDMDKNKYSFYSNVQKQRIEQVWIIIINNALDELVKIKEFKNRRIDINIEQSDIEVIVSIKDNAGGIPEDMFDSLFEPFKGSKVSSGMGVGLSIAKQIVEDHGAVIKAYNENDGAVFEVRFKRVE